MKKTVVEKMDYTLQILALTISFHFECHHFGSVRFGLSRNRAHCQCVRERDTHTHTQRKKERKEGYIKVFYKRDRQTDRKKERKKRKTFMSSKAKIWPMRQLVYNKIASHLVDCTNNLVTPRLTVDSQFGHHNQ